jgi:farnesyl-diphosphate farnesyltransferase
MLRPLPAASSACWSAATANGSGKARKSARKNWKNNIREGSLRHFPMHELLKAVSRTFYLSLRLLPAALRSEISLAYLLARTSDTLADCLTEFRGLRLEMLREFRREVLSDSGPGEELARSIAAAAADPGLRPAEAELLRQAGACFRSLRETPPDAARHILGVLGHILEGQLFDVERFDAPASGAMALETAAELDRYTYLVAGSVGVFWTDMIALKLPGALRRPADEMRVLGRNFGQGLQLVNILRDLPADLGNGRCYLPMEDLRAAGMQGGASEWRQQEGAFAAVQREWLVKARKFIASGETYAESLGNIRLRLTARLPQRLADATLALLEAAPPGTIAAGAKISRARVKRLLAATALRSIFG